MQKCNRCKRDCKKLAEVFCFTFKGLRLVYEQWSKLLCARCLRVHNRPGYSVVNDPHGIAAK